MNAIPNHVAIIPDGNRRWAKAQGKSAVEGHKAGAETFRKVALHAADCGVRSLSIWGLSLENIGKRSAAEVAGLMRIFRDQFRSLASSADIHARKVRVNVIGRWQERLPAVVQREIRKAIEATQGYDGLRLNFFLAYNGTDEMLRAIQGIISEERASFTSGEESSSTPEVSLARLKQHLMTRDLPPVDLLIRTAGEPHLSAGFMMWEVADAELYFPEVYWPDFTPAEFDKALEFYAARERRFGK